MNGTSIIIVQTVRIPILVTKYQQKSYVLFNSLLTVQYADVFIQMLMFSNRYSECNLDT